MILPFVLIRVTSFYMDLSNQIGSLFIIGFPGPRLEKEMSVCRDIVERNLGGVILFNRCLHSPVGPVNIESFEQLVDLCSSLQETAGGKLLIGADQEGGLVRRLRPEAGFEPVCSAAEMGSSGADTGRTREQASTSAAMLSATGINVNFAPVVDCNVNPLNPIIGGLGRSFSDDPEQVARHARAWIETHRSHGIISCCKHFPGHGSSHADSHLGFVDISSSWRPQELIPYRLLLEETAVDMIMTGHLYNSRLDKQYPATLSKTIIDGILRVEMGYEGVVISDDMQMKAITDHFGFEEAVCKSLAAGVDMLVFGNNLDYDPEVCTRAVSAVLNGLEKKLLTEERLRSALGRVATLKEQLGNNDE